MELIDFVKEKGVVRIIDGYLDQLNHAEKMKNVLKELKEKNQRCIEDGREYYLRYIKSGAKIYKGKRMLFKKVVYLYNEEDTTTRILPSIHITASLILLRYYHDKKCHPEGNILDIISYRYYDWDIAYDFISLEDDNKTSRIKYMYNNIEEILNR